MTKVDEGFFDRADAHIELSNNQNTAGVGKGKVSASMMYGTARFNAWVVSTTFENQAEMKDSKEEIVKYFTEQYSKMLLENVDDYIENFETYGSK